MISNKKVKAKHIVELRKDYLTYTERSSKKCKDIEKCIPAKCCKEGPKDLVVVDEGIDGRAEMVRRIDGKKVDYARHITAAFNYEHSIYPNITRFISKASIAVDNALKNGIEGLPIKSKENPRGKGQAISFWSFYWDRNIGQDSIVYFDISCSNINGTTCSEIAIEQGGSTVFVDRSLMKNHYYKKSFEIFDWLIYKYGNLTAEYTPVG